MNSTQMEIKLAESFLEMNETERALLLEVMDLITGHPARRDMAANWKGKVSDLPAALREIE